MNGKIMKKRGDIVWWEYDTNFDQIGIIMLLIEVYCMSNIIICIYMYIIMYITSTN